MSESRRWIIVSNRLPFDRDLKTLKLVRSSGGLVSAITGIKSDEEKVWIGAAPTDLSVEEWEQSSYASTKNPRYVPVFISKKYYNAYYNNIANDVLWPLFHYESGRVNFSWSDWSSYQKINDRFAETLSNIVRPNDLVWIHDFHLFLVPQYFKKRHPKIKTGFFLHIPFPTSEIFRQLPVREEILNSLLCADLLGFHDYSYLRHFCSSVLNVLGIESSLLRVEYSGHIVRLGVFPVGIDTQKFIKESQSQEVSALITKFKKGLQTEFLILGVDRLDYTKGILKKLLAFREFLRNYPEFRGRVSLLQCAIPSRIGIPEYMEIKRRLDRLVGEINGEFGKIDYVPVHYLFSSLSFHELLALYRMSHILLVTSKRDGMNLVSLEYLASQDPKDPGTVILSEFAGASSILSHVVSINPWDIRGTAEAIAFTLKSSGEEKIEKHAIMLNHLKNYTATYWAKSFMKCLETKTGLLSPKAKTIIKSEDDRLILPESIRNLLPIPKPYLILSFDNLLFSNQEFFKDVRMHLDIFSNKGNIVLITSKGSEFSNNMFSGLNISIAAEHGTIFYCSQRKAWIKRISAQKNVWYNTALEIMEDYSSRVPGSEIEKKEFSLTWHYNKSPANFASYQARKLEEDLELNLMNLPIKVVSARSRIEVRAVEADMESFIKWYLFNYNVQSSSIICIGEDKNDEELFIALPDEALSVKLCEKGGDFETNAKFCLLSKDNFFLFLKEIIK